MPTNEVEVRVARHISKPCILDETLISVKFHRERAEVDRVLNHVGVQEVGLQVASFPIPVLPELVTGTHIEQSGRFEESREARLWAQNAPHQAHFIIRNRFHEDGHSRKEDMADKVGPLVEGAKRLYRRKSPP